MTEQEIIELRQHYKNAFSGSSGQVVFHDMMLRAGIFDSDIAEDKAEAEGRRNFMVETIKIIGAYGENPEAVSKAVCDALLQQPIKIAREEEE